MSAYSSKKTITAVTVTFNRAETLERCIKALLNQTLKPDNIIIVDNNSRDDIKEKVRGIAGQDERIHLVFLEENMGGAGGFEVGMKLAYTRYTADWYWIMDDDAYPRTDCLQKLLTATDEIAGKTSKPLGFITPLIFGIDNREYQFYHHKYIREPFFNDIPIVSTYSELKEINSIDANAFVGPLVSNEAVKKYGLADGSLFIYGDDTEYTYRITRNMSAYMIRSAVIEHQDPPKTGDTLKPESWWKEYYSYRNHLLLIKKYSNGPIEKMLGISSIIYKLVKAAGAAAVKPKYKGYRLFRVKLLLKAFADGIRENRGKRIDPADYRNRLEKLIASK